MANPYIIDAQAAALLRELEEGASTEVLDLSAQRAASNALVKSISDESRHQFDGLISNSIVGASGIPVRRYVPHDAVHGRAVVYFHGGGWVFGGVDSVDRIARAIARVLRVTVISVEYRLAPEHPFPVPLRDCVEVAQLMRGEFSQWCAVAGDSAGGNLALATALSAPPGTYDAQMLIYPCLDATMSTPSYQQFGEGYGLTSEAMTFFWQAYGAGHDVTDQLLSPASVVSVETLPPTLLVQAGVDVLADEGSELARRLAASDVASTVLTYPTLPHGFVDMVDRVDASRQAVIELVEAFRVFLPQDVE